MATKLKPIVVATPAPETVVTPIVKRPWWGRAFDIAMATGAFCLALLSSMGTIDFASLGFSPTQAAWGGMAVFCIRFALTYRPVKLVDVKADPAPGTGP